MSCQNLFCLSLRAQEIPQTPWGIPRATLAILWHPQGTHRQTTNHLAYILSSPWQHFSIPWTPSGNLYHLLEISRASSVNILAPLGTLWQVSGLGQDLGSPRTSLRNPFIVISPGHPLAPLGHPMTYERFLEDPGARYGNPLGPLWNLLNFLVNLGNRRATYQGHPQAGQESLEQHSGMPRAPEG